MKAMVLLAAFLGFASWVPQANVQQPKPEDFGLPQLHRINTVTLSPSYGCRSEEDFHRGYEETALFLSDLARRRNAPELLFNGACKSTDNFETDDLGVIADLGKMPLEKLTAHLLFNTRNIAAFDLYSKFAKSVQVQSDHTYAVLLNGDEVRGLLAFTVTEYVPNKKVVLKYAVKRYEVLRPTAQSPGFEWEAQSN